MGIRYRHAPKPGSPTKKCLLSNIVLATDIPDDNPVDFAFTQNSNDPLFTKPLLHFSPPCQKLTRRLTQQVVTKFLAGQWRLPRFEAYQGLFRECNTRPVQPLGDPIVLTDVPGSVTNVPEPQTYAMLLMGLCLL